MVPETMKNIRLVIFDLDGTTLYTLEDISRELNRALQKYSLPVREKEYIRRYIGNGIHYAIEQIVPKDTAEEMIEKVFQAFTASYAVHCGDHTVPYEGIPALLQKLKENGILTAVVSNKKESAVKKLDEQYFPHLFDAESGEREDIRRKPAPDTVLAVLKQLHVKKEEAVYIGDTEVDIATAANAGMDCISVTWGYRDADDLSRQGAGMLVHTVKELEEILLKQK